MSLARWWPAVGILVLGYIIATTQWYRISYSPPSLLAVQPQHMTQQPDGSFKTEWDLKLDAIVNKLNSAPNLQLFQVSTSFPIYCVSHFLYSLPCDQVGPQGKLLGGDILLSKGPDDEFEAFVKNVKPGIWTITEKPRNDPMNFEGVLLRWVALGPLDWDNLPFTLPEPNLAPLSEWKRVSGYSVDSGTHGLLDKDSLEELIETQEDNDKEFILETLADYALMENKLAVKAGFVSESYPSSRASV